MLNAALKNPYFGSIGTISVSPDNRRLFIQGDDSLSPSATFTAYLVKGTQLTPLNRSEHTDHGAPLFVDTPGKRLYAGLLVYSDDAKMKDHLLLKNLGTSYSNAGLPANAYLSWSACLANSPKDAEVKKLRDQAVGELIRTTGGKCSACDGEGSFTVLVEEGGARKKISTPCRTCKGEKRAWKKPCLPCGGTGRLGYSKYCEECYGSGHTLEPLGASF